MNRFRSLILAGMLAILTISTAAAKSLEVSFASQTKVGTVELKPGEYRLSLDGNKATFTNLSTMKTFKTEVKMEDVETKFNNTRVITSSESGATVVKHIEIGGSKSKAVF